MKNAALQLIVILAMVGSSAAWAQEETELHCGLNLGGSDLEQNDKRETEKKYSAYTRSLAGPRIEKLEHLALEDAFIRVPATDRLLPELLTLANFGCIWRF